MTSCSQASSGHFVTGKTLSFSRQRTPHSRCSYTASNLPQEHNCTASKHFMDSNHPTPSDRSTVSKQLMVNK